MVVGLPGTMLNRDPDGGHTVVSFMEGDGDVRLEELHAVVLDASLFRSTVGRSVVIRTLLMLQPIGLACQQ